MLSEDGYFYKYYAKMPKMTLTKSDYYLILI